jgi:hypothetical protein
VLASREDQRRHTVDDGERPMTASATPTILRDHGAVRGATVNISSASAHLATRQRRHSPQELGPCNNREISRTACDVTMTGVRGRSCSLTLRLGVWLELVV